jgi:hypothetical protein
MWYKKVQPRARDIPKYPEGTIIRRNDDPETIALVIYRNLHDYQKDSASIMAAEFVHNPADDNITFKQNVAVSEDEVTIASPVSYFKTFLDISWNHHQETGGFYRSARAYNDIVDAKRREAEAPQRYTVMVELVNGTKLEWNKLFRDAAIATYNDLKAAQTSGAVWQSTHAKTERESISGKYIVRVNLT